MKIRTHDGVFHADEAMAVAIVQMVWNKTGLPKPEVIRTRRDVEADMHIDVGMKYDGNVHFDHHQSGGAGYRLEGPSIPYASAGLVWKTFGLGLCKLATPVTDNEQIAVSMFNVVDTRLIRPIDAVDTGWNRGQEGLMSPLNLTFSDLIKSLNDLENGRCEAWDEALHICRVALIAALQGAFNYVMQATAAEKAIAEAIADGGEAVLLPGYVSGWHNLVFAAPGNSVLRYAVYLSDRGEKPQWMAEAIPTSASNSKLRAPFPEAWVGRTPEEFRKLTQVPDAIFCHANRFLCVAESFEGVQKLLSLAHESFASTCSEQVPA